MINKDETITISQCRELRELMKAFTNGCMINQGEYFKLLLVFNEIGDRLEREGMVRE